jgi:C-terminal, D2-small domain, of ClpB protein/ABC-2 type transporter
MIFMTSNIGAREMSAMVKPRLGFSGPFSNRQEPTDMAGPLRNEMARTGIDAACRKFTPEFINRIDKMVVFKPLRATDMERILDIELNSVRQRIFNIGSGCRFFFRMTPSAKQFLLNEGTNVEYGARHLKRTIERLVVQPLSKLIASGQILSGDLIQIDYESESALTFNRQDEGMPLADMVLVGSNPVMQPMFMLSGFTVPIRNMPDAIQYLTYLNPLRYYMEIVRGVFLKGSGLDVLWPQTAALMIIGLVIISLSVLRFKKRLD